MTGDFCVRQPADDFGRRRIAKPSAVVLSARHSIDVREDPCLIATDEVSSNAVIAAASALKFTD
jgi:hypothetical protein